MNGRGWILAGLIGLSFGSMGCGGRAPEDLGQQGGALRPCPSSPNCVSSAVDPSDSQHAIAAFVIEGDPRIAWRALVATVEGLPRTEVVTRTDDYLHAVQTSRLMRYKDDFEFLLTGPEARVQVRSASRVGYGDMGVNRDRIEVVRAALVEQGVVASD